MLNAQPIYEGPYTGGCTTDIEGGRILTVAAAKRDGEPLPVKHCGAADEPIGVSLATAARDGVCTVIPPGTKLLLDAAEAVTAGDPIEVAADGKVQRLDRGRRVGVAFTTCARGEVVLASTQF